MNASATQQMRDHAKPMRAPAAISPRAESIAPLTPALSPLRGEGEPIDLSSAAAGFSLSPDGERAGVRGATGLWRPYALNTHIDRSGRNGAICSENSEN